MVEEKGTQVLNAEIKQRESYEPVKELDAVQAFRSALELVQFGGTPWKQMVLQAADWGYGGVQPSNFHLDPKELATGDLATVVNEFLNEVESGDGRGKMGLAGYSTHCDMMAWLYSMHPGIAAILPPNAPKEELVGKPNEIRSWMWDNRVKYIPEACKKLGLRGTHTFIPPAALGLIEGMEWAGAKTADYPFVPTHEVPVMDDGQLVKKNLWHEAMYALAQHLEPLFDAAKEAGGTQFWHEMHPDTFARGIAEYKLALELLGEKAKKYIGLGMDTSHAWQGETGEQWIEQGGDDIGSLHIKNNQIHSGKPLITGIDQWVNRGMHFGAADQGLLSPADVVAMVAAYSQFMYTQTRINEPSIGKLSGRLVYQKFAIAEGEHPLISQNSIAIEFAKVLNMVCQRKYSGGFQLGLTKG